MCRHVDRQVCRQVARHGHFFSTCQVSSKVPRCPQQLICCTFVQHIYLTAYMQSRQPTGWLELLNWSKVLAPWSQQQAELQSRCSRRHSAYKNMKVIQSTGLQLTTSKLLGSGALPDVRSCSAGSMHGASCKLITCAKPAHAEAWLATSRV